MDNAFEQDPEDPIAQKRGDSSKREFTEAAFLLAMWSILVANEGVIRFIQHGAPSAPNLLSSTGLNRFAAPFLGGLFEVIFGLFGLCVGLSAAVLDYYSKPLTTALIATQSILGWYVFIDYVFLIPSYTISTTAAPMIAGLTVGASKFIGVMGIMTSLAFCLALQGGQFVFMARLVAFSSDRDFLKQRSGAKMRAIFWNANLALAGLWVVITAFIVIANVGAGLTPARFFAPPNVGRIPVYLLAIGLLMLIWPLMGIAISFSGSKTMVRPYCAATFFVFLAVHVHYTIGQLGFLAAAPNAAVPAAGASMHNGLVMMVTFLGPYFMLKQAQEDDV